MGTPRQVIESVVRSVCGSDVEQLVRFAGDGMNETYRGELAGTGSSLCASHVSWCRGSPTRST